MYIHINIICEQRNHQEQNVYPTRSHVRKTEHDVVNAGVVWFNIAHITEFILNCMIYEVDSQHKFYYCNQFIFLSNNMHLF